MVPLEHELNRARENPRSGVKWRIGNLLEHNPIKIVEIIWDEIRRNDGTSEIISQNYTFFHGTCDISTFFEI